MKESSPPPPPSLLDQQLQASLQGDFELGWKLVQKLAIETPHCNRAKFNRGWYEMHHGRLLRGLEYLDFGRWEGVFGSPPLLTNQPIYRLGQAIQGKKLLLRLEGGLGDEIIHARFAAQFAALGADVTISCHKGLASVLARVPGVSAVVHHEAAHLVYHDYWVPAMSAARVLELEYSDLNGAPYLTVQPEIAKKWKQILDTLPTKPRIGLRFFGNPQFEHEQFRRFPEQELVKAVGSIPWVSLQLESSALPIQNWEDTLAVIAQLELVITSCTSVAHAAAALGKPTWVLVPVLPYYIWALPGESSPWYESVRLFRQKKFGCWQSVFDDVRATLSAQFHG